MYTKKYLKKSSVQNVRKKSQKDFSLGYKKMLWRTIFYSERFAEVIEFYRNIFSPAFGQIKKMM